MDTQTLRQIFKQVNKFMVLMWRLGLGKWINIWPAGIGRIMVIGHTGRKSGLKRRTPVNYAIVKDEIYCIAGFGEQSDWFLNIRADPKVEVWLPEGWWAGEAAPAEEHGQRLAIIRQILINSGFAAPLFEGIFPSRLSDAEMEKISKDYRLIRIRRSHALTGTGGPGDLALVWPATLLVLLVLWLLKRSQKRRY